MPAAKRASTITEVWASNVEQEIDRISSLIGDHNHVALDTEFPGVVMRIVSNDGLDANYQTIRQNVNVLKLIQLGLTISNSDGLTNASNENHHQHLQQHLQHHHHPETWQFNFSFSLLNDMYSQDSIDLLQQSGVNFIAHEKNGIDPIVFADLITTSGLLCNDAIQWITFHGSYDFAYLLKTLVGKNLPKSQNEFFRLLHVLFPKRHDLKCLIRNKHSTTNTDSSFLHTTTSTTTTTTSATTTNPTIASTTSTTTNNNINNPENNSDSNNNLDNVNGQNVDIKNSNSTNVTPTKVPNDSKSTDENSNSNSNSKSSRDKTLKEKQKEDRSKRPLYGGLNRIAQLMGCERVGMTHQAGSDSLLTLNVYLRVRDDVLHGEIDAADDGRLYGLGGGLFH